MSNLHNLAAVGQSIWIDSLSREMLQSGALAAELDANAVTGVTSNPSIFAKAMLSGTDYDPQLEELVGRDASVDEIYTALVTQDIQQACDVMRSVFDGTTGADGFVSVEVSPELAHDTEGTVAEARDWVKRVNRPNLLIKVPSTVEGVPAVEALIAEGISVNVTLIFSRDRYQSVMEAYISGLERYQRSGGDISAVASVASFFVSRVDTEVDARLEAIGTDEANALRGLAAIANARVAYLQFLQTFSTGRWLELAVDGARVQQPLWASTSTKNPDYSDTIYVDTLAAPTTVNTMPELTIAAYQDHGPTYPKVLDIDDMNDGVATLRRLADVGIDYADVTDILEREGVDKFADAFKAMVADIERKRAALKGA
jgi:transaldolase